MGHECLWRYEDGAWLAFGTFFWLFRLFRPISFASNITSMMMMRKQHEVENRCVKGHGNGGRRLAKQDPNIRFLSVRCYCFPGFTPNRSSNCRRLPFLKINKLLILPFCPCFTHIRPLAPLSGSVRPAAWPARLLNCRPTWRARLELWPVPKIPKPSMRKREP